MPRNNINLQNSLLSIHDNLRENIINNRNNIENLEQSIWQTRNMIADVLENHFNIEPNNDYRFNGNPNL
jgi:hypothetical protein|tara:strand:+ start:365 stop:571 length:207 start_codon:yes stop_codon:yes gene_type:complete